MSPVDHREFFESLRSAGKVTIKYKNESRTMKLIGLIAGREFMDNTTSTVGETIYYPSRSWVERDYSRAWECLCHELVHVFDYRNTTPRWLYLVKYLFPHWLVIGALLAPILWVWWPLAFLVFLAPIPSPWRLQYEMRGYGMTMAVWYWYKGSGIPTALKADIAKILTSSAYYWMSWSGTHVSNEVGKWSKAILCDEVSAQGAVYSQIELAIKSRVAKPY